MKNHSRVIKPVLYDTHISRSFCINFLFWKWEKKWVLEYHKGLFDYEKNKFCLTKKQLDNLAKNPKRASDLKCIEATGYEIVKDNGVAV